jgi:transcription initiation factor TFIID subunit 13
MYGSGDQSRPMYESVCLLEDMVVDFIQEMTKSAVIVAGNRDRLKTEDLLFALRDKPRLSTRAQELLEMHKLVRSHNKSSRQKAENLADIAKGKRGKKRSRRSS